MLVLLQHNTTFDCCFKQYTMYHVPHVFFFQRIWISQWHIGINIDVYFIYVILIAMVSYTNLILYIIWKY